MAKKIAVEETLDIRMTIRFTKSEHDSMYKKVRQRFRHLSDLQFRNRIKLSTICRHILLDKKFDVSPEKTDIKIKMYYEIHKIGVNINQIAKGINRGEASTKEVENKLREVKEML